MTYCGGEALQHNKIDQKPHYNGFCAWLCRNHCICPCRCVCDKTEYKLKNIPAISVAAKSSNYSYPELVELVPSRVKVVTNSDLSIIAICKKYCKFTGRNKTLILMVR